MRLADNTLSVKIAVWKNHESNFGISDKRWVNEAIVASSLKVTGRGGDDHTELTTTNGSRIWAASGDLTETLKGRAVSAENITSMSKPYESGGTDYTSIDGESIHLSTLASLLMPNVATSVTKTSRESSLSLIS